MADWSTVTLVPWMRFSSWPSIRGSHWLKFLSRPAKSNKLFSIFQKCRRTQNLKIKEGERFVLLPRWRCRKASVALLERSMASSGSISPFSFISFPIQLPVRKVKSGKLWWTVPLMKECSWKKTPQETDFYRIDETKHVIPSSAPSMIPDRYHPPLYDGRVQLPHAADVPRPLELLWVDEEDRLLHPRKDLII